MVSYAALCYHSRGGGRGVGVGKYICSFEAFKKHHIYIRMNGDNFSFRESDGTWKVVKEGAVSSGKIAPVLFLDANKDGVKDVFLKAFDGSANAYYCLLSQS